MDGVSERALGGMDRHFAPHERICAEAGENKTKDCFDWLHFIPLAKTKQKNSAQKILNGVLYLFFWLMITSFPAYRRPLALLVLHSSLR